MRKNPDLPIEPYNLKDDLSERNNIDDNYPAVVKEIGQILGYVHIPNKY